MNMNDKEFAMLLDEIKTMEFAEPFENILDAPAPTTTKPVATTPAPKKKAKSAISDSELDTMFVDIQATFADKSFKNRDLGDLLDKWGLSSRQTPSRLKKLVDAGLLQDLGGSPKSYQVK